MKLSSFEEEEESDAVEAEDGERRRVIIRAGRGRVGRRMVLGEGGESGGIWWEWCGRRKV